MGARQAGRGNRQRGGALGIAAIDHQLHLVRQLGREQVEKAAGCCDHRREAPVGHVAADAVEERIQAAARAVLVVELDPQSGGSCLALDPSGAFSTRILSAIRRPAPSTVRSARAKAALLPPAIRTGAAEV